VTFLYVAVTVFYVVVTVLYIPVTVSYVQPRRRVRVALDVREVVQNLAVTVLYVQSGRDCLIYAVRTVTVLCVEP